jgi:group I intron endonuclease
MLFNITHADRNKAGVYLIRNSIDERIYIGASKCLGTRFRDHRRLLRARSHYNTALQALVDLYGLGILSFHLVELCAPEKLLERERQYIHLHQATNPQTGFNQAVKGWKMSESARANMSVAGRGKVVGDETRAKMSAARKGRLIERPNFKLTEAHKAALAEGLRSATQKGLLQGRILTDEHKAKIRASSKGRVVSPETKAKMSAAQKARAGTPEAKASFAARMKDYYRQC